MRKKKGYHETVIPGFLRTVHPPWRWAAAPDGPSWTSRVGELFKMHSPQAGTAGCHRCGQCPLGAVDPDPYSRKIPPILYDYYGFPPEAYEINYPATGSPGLAETICSLLKFEGINAQLDRRWGFDHGMFVPLKLMYPNADIPCSSFFGLLFIGSPLITVVLLFLWLLFLGQSAGV